MTVCLEPGCPKVVMRGRCPQHARVSSRNHFGVSRQARGYDRQYEVARLTLIGEPCALRLDGCTGVSTTAQHTDDGRLVPACAHCNYADGAARGRRSKNLGSAIPAG